MVYTYDKSLVENLQRLHQSEKKNLDGLRRELKGIKGGTLYMRKRGSSYFFSEYVAGRQKGITKNTTRVHQLARREYLRKAIAIADNNCRCLEQVLSDLDHSAWDRQKEVTEKFFMLNLAKICRSASESKWCDAAYETNPVKPETLRYATGRGIKMRSKSERFIGNMLEVLEIPYRYEAKLQIGWDVFYPDFTIRKRTGELVLWEHLGLMDREDYYVRAMKKIDQYRKAGFKQHHNLICTWEDDLEDGEILEQIVGRYIYDS